MVLTQTFFVGAICDMPAESLAKSRKVRVKLDQAKTTKLDGLHSEGTCQFCPAILNHRNQAPNYTPGVDFFGP